MLSELRAHHMSGTQHAPQQGHDHKVRKCTVYNDYLLVRYGAQIAHFAEVLCSLFSPSHPLPTLNIPLKFGRPEFQVVSGGFRNYILITQTVVYPVLAALASYNRSLDGTLQKQLIKCFQYGLVVSKCNQVGKIKSV